MLINYIVFPFWWWSIDDVHVFDNNAFHSLSVSSASFALSLSLYRSSSLSRFSSYPYRSHSLSPINGALSAWLRQQHCWWRWWRWHCVPFKADFWVISCFEDFPTFLPINFPHFACQPILNLSNRHTNHHWTDDIYFHASQRIINVVTTFQRFKPPKMNEGDSVFGTVNAITVRAPTLHKQPTKYRFEAPITQQREKKIDLHQNDIHLIWQINGKHLFLPFHQIPSRFKRFLIPNHWQHEMPWSSFFSYEFLPNFCLANTRLQNNVVPFEMMQNNKKQNTSM